MKEKKSREELNNGVGQFYYETIGMISLIIAIVLLAKLGSVGKFLTVFLKVLFGDWYLLIVLLILIFGIYLILNHHSFNFKNQRFLGYIFCIFSFLMLSHFSVHNYVLTENTSYFGATWNHYKAFMSSGVDTYLGGGLIGAVFFYVFYSLLGDIGVILVSIIFIILGFTMIINKSLTELLGMLLNIFKRAGKYHKSFNDFFKYEIGRKENKINTIYDSRKKITLKLLDDYKNYNFLNSQSKYIEDLKTIIASTLNSLNLRYRNIQTFASYSSSLVVYHIYDDFDLNTLGIKLSTLIDENIYITRVGNVLNIEINNKYISILSLKELLMKQPILYNNYLIPIGMNVKNQLEEIDFSKEANMLVTGDFDVGIKSFITSLILSSIIKVGTENLEYNLYDEVGDFNNYHYLFNSINNGDFKDFLTMIINQIDERVNLLSLKNIHQIDEYNIIMTQNKKETLKRIIYIIELDDFNNSYDYKYIDDKIMYLIQVGRDMGIYVIFISRNIKKVSTILYSLFKHRFIFNVGKNKTNLIESKQLEVLINKGECIFHRDTYMKRIQTPKLTIDEYKKIKQEK